MNSLSSLIKRVIAWTASLRSDDRTTCCARREWDGIDVAPNCRIPVIGMRVAQDADFFNATDYWKCRHCLNLIRSPEPVVFRQPRERVARVAQNKKREAPKPPRLFQSLALARLLDGCGVGSASRQKQTTRRGQRFEAVPTRLGSISAIGSSSVKTSLAMYRIAR